tara:strand:- start:2069 stop:2188 length:120 start_codon:yes stop_codon:yes gene_type:complete
LLEAKQAHPICRHIVKPHKPTLKPKLAKEPAKPAQVTAF